MLTVRKMTPELLPRLRELSSASLAGEDVLLRIGRSGFTLGYVPLARAEWRSFPPPACCDPAKLGTAHSIIMLAAFEDDLLVGSAAMLHTDEGWTEILDIRVDAAHRRQGVARAMLQAVEDASLRHGMMGLKMTVTDDNPTACQFCEHCGFTLQGLDKMALIYNPVQREKPLARRASQLFFYRLHQKG